MREISLSMTFEIQPGETVPMKVARSTRLTVRGASVWATRSNDVADYFLLPGDTLKLRRGERLWLSVDGETSACVSFSAIVPPQQAAVSGIVRLAARFVALFRDGWRTV
ncbi:DUF2917 domain-containing protein [Burkholderia thailandensis]|uniref:DUF2917 domain-containing protein n=1 Tax=Burkholderia thailandensis (strain ATCC 700388 / DSM 13276 / CCUG 48851 / CIP 106301 / E264) TaxID=271848 RepID=Q2T1K7_BURTA|nr:DUF2917 domain-containing protein [Burkholderia thailandensis]ABC37832.1 conserved hypothetical protein [Burkholderia thailandensis E264]AHI73823.1 hypothetical protein BTQ_406 [Burkholderia thailandensis 2002721723]AHI79301.1 hypothetical protein BTJ_2080 [Burkholderia thailandensis E444]AIC88516.1 hypothetical protein BTRA_195 [Burkholderia thailandensis USAMRU Malaysia \